jgi:rRNA maturation endonuclease Nob1
MSTKLYDISSWCRQGSELENYPYIGEIDIDLDLGEVAKVGGSYYVPGVLNCANKSAGVRKMEINLQPVDKDYEHELTCPYCGYKDSDSWELSDEDEEHECGRCGAIMSYQRVVTVEYNSSPKKPPDVVTAKWKL